LQEYGSASIALLVIHIPFGENLYPRSVWYKEFMDKRTATQGWFEDIQKRGSENELEIRSRMKNTRESIHAEIS
jgi:hypothetical protein